MLQEPFEPAGKYKSPDVQHLCPRTGPECQIVKGRGLVAMPGCTVHPRRLRTNSEGLFSDPAAPGEQARPRDTQRLHHQGIKVLSFRVAAQETQQARVLGQMSEQTLCLALRHRVPEGPRQPQGHPRGPYQCKSLGLRRRCDNGSSPLLP